MFEKEAEEYVMREDVITENDKVPFDNGYGFQTVSFEDEVKKGFQDGAAFGYNKANEWHYVKDGFQKGAEPREKRIEELEAQIEKMKNWCNCKNYQQCLIELAEQGKGMKPSECCINCKKWEIKEND